MSKSKKSTGPTFEIEDPVEDNPFLQADPEAMAGAIRELIALAEARDNDSGSDKKKTPKDLD